MTSIQEFSFKENQSRYTIIQMADDNSQQYIKCTLHITQAKTIANCWA